MDLRVEYDDLEIAGFDGGGTAIMHYQGQPFTGFMITTTNGVLCEEQQHENGYQQGIIREYYYPGGNLRYEYTVINNSLEGVFKEYSEEGNLISESNWHKGQEIS